MINENEIIIFETKDKSISLPVRIENESVWLNRNQMAELFERDVKTIGKHINNALREELSEQNSVVAKFATTASDNKTYMVEHYNLDVIISVGYRVKSKRGVEFRRWANSVLKEYILKGYAVNHKRMNQLNEVIRVMKRVENSLDSKQVLAVVERYSQALDLLDAYDHQNMMRPKGNTATYILTYEECRKVIDSMKYGNKRIAAAIFLYFLDKNNALFKNEEKLIDDHTIVALTIMIAESNPEEKEMMVSVVMNCMK